MSNSVKILLLVMVANLFLLNSKAADVMPEGAIQNKQSATYEIWGTQTQKSPIYKAGEEMKFLLKVRNNSNPSKGITLQWKRTGDDGITLKGSCITDENGQAIIVAKTDKPGFVRIYVTAYTPEGKQIKRENGKPVIFDGGACVAPQTLQGLPEPNDFDKYWADQKKRLIEIPLKVIEMIPVKGAPGVKAFDVKLTCPGGMPVSGYLTMPENPKMKSLKAEVSFMGYGVGSARKKLSAGKSIIAFNINAHGILNGQDKTYYHNLKTTKLRGYAFSKEKNSNRDTTYFNGMVLRLMRALEFIKSLPEWNGKDLKVSGGSQGGYQSLIAAGLDNDVNSCFAWSPWCCDFGRTKLNRIVGGWYIKYTPALEYYDPINHVKRANPKCKLYMVNNLGDYVCPPSGVWIAYNNFPGPKTLEVRQGCEHSYTMKNYPKYIIRNK